MGYFLLHCLLTSFCVRKKKLCPSCLKTFAFKFKLKEMTTKFNSKCQLPHGCSISHSGNAPLKNKLNYFPSLSLSLFSIYLQEIWWVLMSCRLPRRSWITPLLTDQRCLAGGCPPSLVEDIRWGFSSTQPATHGLLVIVVCLVWTKFNRLAMQVSKRVSFQVSCTFWMFRTSKC